MSLTISEPKGFDAEVDSLVGVIIEKFADCKDRNALVQALIEAAVEFEDKSCLDLVFGRLEGAIMKRASERSGLGNKVWGKGFHQAQPGYVGLFGLGDNRQFRVEKKLDDGRYVIQLFSFWDGEPSDQKTVTADQMSKWCFYTTKHSWLAAGKRVGDLSFSAAICRVCGCSRDENRRIDCQTCGDHYKTEIEISAKK